MSRLFLSLLALALNYFLASHCVAYDFEFYGRTGNAIEVDFGKRPNVPRGATFSDLALQGFDGHTVLTSSELSQGDFATDGRLWVFANPAFDSVSSGDTDPAARGFQGALSGTVRINGVEHDFSVTVRPGYTGAGPGQVLQSFESINNPGNNQLYVAQQQQRLRYFGFQKQGTGAIGVDGDFGPNTDSALRTFQGAFVANVNTGQSNVDGIIGPNTASWLNAANAPTWDELIDSDPQVPGTFSLGNMIGDYDILPSRDRATGVRTGLTPQIERFGTNWSINLWEAGSALAKSATGVTQLMTAMSTEDGYSSSAFHNTHRVGMDVDMHVDVSTWSFGNGIINAAEQDVIDAAVAYIDAGEMGDPNRGRIIRIIASNRDIMDGILALRPGTPFYLDSSTIHQNHLHLDVGRPAQVAGIADMPGDFNLDDRVDGRDFLFWQRGGSLNPLSNTDFALWRSSFGDGVPFGASVTIPEPSSFGAILIGLLLSNLWQYSRS